MLSNLTSKELASTFQKQFPPCHKKKNNFSPFPHLHKNDFHLTCFTGFKNIQQQEYSSFFLWLATLLMNNKPIRLKCATTDLTRHQSSLGHLPSYFIHSIKIVNAVTIQRNDFWFLWFWPAIFFG